MRNFDTNYNATNERLVVAVIMSAGPRLTELNSGSKRFQVKGKTITVGLNRLFESVIG